MDHFVYRLCKAKYAKDLSGTGARIAGGRWNSKGNAVLYTSSSRSLALTEFLVHLPQIFMPEELCLITLKLPSSLPQLDIQEQTLPDEWKKFPFSVVTQKIGDQWLKKGEYPLFKVPSAIVDEEFNYLINPMHPDAAKTTIADIQQFNLDERLLRK